jgi:tetratricopeptide (TPR) repeat protein
MAELHKDKKDERIIDIESTYHRLENFFNQNQKLIYGITIGVLAIVGGVIYYIKGIQEPREKEAQTEVFYAEYYFGLDSFDLALNGQEDVFKGFLTMIEEYGGTKVGNLSQLYSGICYMKKGEFENAIEHLNEFSSRDVILGAEALGLIGDAYRELGQPENAVKYYEKAVRHSDNSFTAPIFLKKAAMPWQHITRFGINFLILPKVAILRNTLPDLRGSLINPSSCRRLRKTSL